MSQISGKARILSCCALFFLCGPVGSIALAQSGSITVEAVSNGASFVQNAVAPGSIASIFGTGLAPSPPQGASGLPLPTNLNGVTVTVNGILAPLFYVSPLQINFQLPAEVAAGQASVTVSWGGESSASFAFTVMAAAPGIFKAGATNQAAAQNLDGTANDSNHPVAAGGIITAYLTGQGPVDHPVADGQPASSSPLSNATLPYAATIGNQNAAILFLGLAPTFVGLLQGNIQIPGGLATGSYPLVVTVGGVASNAAMISVAGASGGAPQISFLGSATTQGGGRNVAVLGNTAYVCGGTAIGVVDVTNPASPKVVENFAQGDLGGNGIACLLLGNSLIEIVNTQALFAYDVSKPTAPATLSGLIVPPQPFAGYGFLAGNTAFFTTDWFNYSPGSNQISSQHGEVYAYDFTNLAPPSYLSTLPVDPNQPASSDLSPRFGGVALNNQTAIIASTTSTGGDPNGGLAQLEVIDISKPLAMRAIDQVLIPQATVATSIAVQGNTALVAGDTKSWRNPGIPNFDFAGVLTLSAVDVSNPLMPSVISTQVTGILTNGVNGYGIAPLGDGFFAVATAPPADNNNGPPTGNGQLAVVDARNPQSLQITTVASVPSLGGIAVSNNRLYAATATGLNIYQIQ